MKCSLMSNGWYSLEMLQFGADSEKIHQQGLLTKENNTTPRNHSEVTKTTLFFLCPQILQYRFLLQCYWEARFVFLICLFDKRRAYSVVRITFGKVLINMLLSCFFLRIFQVEYLSSRETFWLLLSQENNFFIQTTPVRNYFQLRSGTSSILVI